MKFVFEIAISLLSLLHHYYYLLLLLLLIIIIFILFYLLLWLSNNMHKQQPQWPASRTTLCCVGSLCQLLCGHSAVLASYRYFKHKFQFVNFNTKNMPLHLSKCSIWNAKKIYEYTQYFSSYERKLMPPFVVLNI